MSPLFIVNDDEKVFVEDNMVDVPVLAGEFEAVENKVVWFILSERLEDGSSLLLPYSSYFTFLPKSFL